MPPTMIPALSPSMGWARPYGARFHHFWITTDTALCGRSGPMTHLTSLPADGEPCYGCTVALSRI